MKASITGKGIVSAIGDGKEELQLPLAKDGWFPAQKPDFAKYFEAKQARRTSKILKMGMVAAFDALGENQSNLDGIIVGTGLGCIGDSEKFITSLIHYEESMLSPTSFIQSTHNTIAGSIALQLKAHQYNFTYSERIFSFEWALLDALMQINETTSNSRFLVGAADELTVNTFAIAKALGVYQDNSLQIADIKTSKDSNVSAGESACFFTLEQANDKDVSLHFVRMFFQENIVDVMHKIITEIESSGVQTVDCILLGINGHKVYDQVYTKFEEAFPESDVAYFKHLCGESLTASAFAFWLATEILETNQLPKIVCIRKNKTLIRSVLIINHLKKDYLSAMLLSI